MIEIICRNGILNLKFIEACLGKKILVKLKKFNTDDFFIFHKFLRINKKILTFDNLGQIGYFEYDLIGHDDKIIESKQGNFVQNISLNINIKNQNNKVHRESSEIKLKNHKENNLIIKNKNEKIYFDTNELPTKLKHIFEDFVDNGTEFIYIQDPYFDFNCYRDLLEKIPINLNVKILYSNKCDSLPNDHKYQLIKSTSQNNINKIHDRFIITKNFGYQIGISLNGIHKNKSFIIKIEDVSQLLREFN